MALDDPECSLLSPILSPQGAQLLADAFLKCRPDCSRAQKAMVSDSAQAAGSSPAERGEAMGLLGTAAGVGCRRRLGTLDCLFVPRIV